MENVLPTQFGNFTRSIFSVSMKLNQMLPFYSYANALKTIKIFGDKGNQYTF